MSFIVYRLDNHAVNHICASKGAATRKLNSLNTQDVLDANKQLPQVLRDIRAYDAAGRDVPADVLADRDDLEKRACGSKPVWATTSVENFDKNVVFMRKVKHLMTGELVEERSDTPYYCSVSSETYWSR